MLTRCVAFSPSFLSRSGVAVRTLFPVDVSGSAGGFSWDYPPAETIGLIESGLGRSRRWGQKPRNLGRKEGGHPGSLSLGADHPNVALLLQRPGLLVARAFRHGLALLADAKGDLPTR